MLKYKYFLNIETFENWQKENNIIIRSVQTTPTQINIINDGNTMLNEQGTKCL